MRAEKQTMWGSSSEDKREKRRTGGKEETGRERGREMFRQERKSSRELGETVQERNPGV
jgi:hypothetical protein